MLYRYMSEKAEYIVEGEEDVDGINITFIARVDGGKGRIPKDKKVQKQELTLLIDMETAKSILED